MPANIIVAMKSAAQSTSELSKGQHSRAVIIAAAKRLILDRGFSAVTLQNILDAAGVTKGRFFHHFASKDELFSSLLRVALTDRSVLEFDELASRSPSPKAIDKLLFLLDRLVEWHEQGLAEEMRLCLLATFFFPPDSAEIERINSIMSANTKVSENLILAAQADGDLPAELDPGVLALMFPSAAVGSNLVGFISRETRLTPRCMVELRKTIAALAGRGGRGK